MLRSGYLGAVIDSEAQISVETYSLACYHDNLDKPSVPSQSRHVSHEINSDWRVFQMIYF